MKKLLILLTIIIGINFAFSINIFGGIVEDEDIKLTSKYKNVIMFIGDGMGLNQVSKLDFPNHFERAQYIGLSKTYSASHKVTETCVVTSSTELPTLATFA